MKIMNIIAAVVLAPGIASSASAATFNDGLLTSAQVTTSRDYSSLVAKTFSDTYMFSIGANQAASFSINGVSLPTMTYNFNPSHTQEVVTTTQLNVGHLSATIYAVAPVTLALTQVATFASDTNRLSAVYGLTGGSYEIVVDGTTTGTTQAIKYNLADNTVMATGATKPSGGQYTFALNDGKVVATPPVPEPGSYALMLSGLAMVGFIAHRRKSNN